MTSGKIRIQLGFELSTVEPERNDDVVQRTTHAHVTRGPDSHEREVENRHTITIPNLDLSAQSLR